MIEIRPQSGRWFRFFMSRRAEGMNLTGSTNKNDGFRSILKHEINNGFECEAPQI